MTRQIACPYCDDGIREYSVGLEIRVEPCPWCSGRGRMVDRRAAYRDRPAFPLLTVILAILLIVAGVALITSPIREPRAAPRTTHQPTVELGPSAGTTAGAGDTSLTVNLGASAVGSSGAPHAGVGQRAVEPVGAP